MSVILMRAEVRIGEQVACEVGPGSDPGQDAGVVGCLKCRCSMGRRMVAVDQQGGPGVPRRRRRRDCRKPASCLLPEWCW